MYILFGVITICFFMYFAAQISYTADYELYRSFYTWEYDETDFIYRNAVLLFKDKQWGFQALYGSHIIAITLLFSFFILKFSKNLFYIFGFFVVLIFIPYINQIRFYLAFPCFLLASYYLLYKRNWILFGVFAVLGALSHSAVTVLYSYFFFYLFVPKKFYNIIFYSAISILFVASYILSSSDLYTYFEHFGEYMKTENQSTILGGIFNILPTITLIVPIYLLDRKYLGDRNDSTYRFLKTTSFFTAVLIPASIFMQIIGQRYVFPFLVVWIIFFLFLIKDKEPAIRNRYIAMSYVIFAFTLYLQYSLADIVFGESFYFEEFIQSIESIGK